MSELKAFEINGKTLFGRTYVKKAYLKSEADAYIAELEEKHKMEVEQLLIEIAELKEAQRWRKFSEEKPEHHQNILALMNNYRTATCNIELRRWDDGCKYDVEMQELYTHWIPLPKEPKI